jgi:hypothetical protein
MQHVFFFSDRKREPNLTDTSDTHFLARDNSVGTGLATGWTVRGSIPGGVEIFSTRPDRPWGPPSLLYSGYRIFSGGKAAGAWR